MIYSIRTTSGREDIVLDMLATKVRRDQSAIASVFHPAEIKGYIFIEGSLGSIQKLIPGMLHVKGVIATPVALDQIRQFLSQKKTVITLNVSDIVEIIGGPFKGEKGRLTRIDKVKDEVTVELLEASIPIPVTITTEFVKLIKRAKQEAAAERPAEPEEPEEAEDTEEKSVFEKVSEDIQKQKPVEELRQSAGETRPAEEKTKPEKTEPAEPAREAEAQKKKEKNKKETEE